MTFKYLIPVFTFPLLMFSCGDQDTKQAENMVEELNQLKNNSTISSSTSPCELLSMEEVKEICETGNEVEMQQEDKKYTYPTCKFSWEDGKVQRKMSVGGRDMTIDLPSEVMVVMVVNASESMYDRSINVYKDGEDISSIGEKATWGTEMSQLSFLEAGYLFHVHVKTTNDNTENKNRAIAIAQVLMSKI